MPDETAMRRFTPAEVEQIRFMAAFGHNGKSIALVQGRTAQAVRVKCVEIGVRLRPAKAANRRLQLPIETWRELRAAADRYNMTASRLANLLIVTIVRDKLFDAVVDVVPPKRRPMAKTKVDPKWSQLAARAALSIAGTP